MVRHGIVVGCVLALAAVPLAGCVGAAVGAGAAAVTAAAEERGLKAAAIDLRIRAEINGLWLDRDVDMYRAAAILVHERRVLLTGTVATPKARGEAVRLAWQARDVREVINEIGVGKATAIATDVHDGWITARLKSRLAFDDRVQAINYSIETASGVVYLMGIAQNKAEIRRVRNHARGISYVRRIVSYVRLKDDPRRRPLK